MCTWREVTNFACQKLRLTPNFKQLSDFQFWKNVGPWSGLKYLGQELTRSLNMSHRASGQFCDKCQKTMIVAIRTFKSSRKRGFKFMIVNTDQVLERELVLWNEVSAKVEHCCSELNRSARLFRVKIQKFGRKLHLLDKKFVFGPLFFVFFKPFSRIDWPLAVARIISNHPGSCLKNPNHIFSLFWQIDCRFLPNSYILKDFYYEILLGSLWVSELLWKLFQLLWK